MRLFKTHGAAGPVATSLVVLAGALSLPSSASAQTKTITIDGSSTVFPISEAVAEEFQKQKKGEVRVTVGISGTGGGFKKFCRGETDISNGSRPILRQEMDECAKNGIKFIEMPIAFDALTVAVSPKNNFLECISVADLKKIWEPAAQGKVINYSDVNPAWPNKKITLFGAGADSGTFDYFTEAVNGKAKATRTDFTASEDDNVLVTGIERDENALGYIPFAYYEPHKAKLKALAIDEGKGKGCVKPSLEAVTAGTYNPLARPLFLYVSTKAAEKPEVKDYVEFLMTKGPALVKEVKYLPLPPAAYATSYKHFKDGRLGTVFGGVPEVGVSVEDLMKRDAKI
ncbi:MAG: PstS family phosphate ABC transporter substrate-binding protein [Bradyrhizobium sp.]|uniref:PstS family phosphate ABC transporter substrate-binding protein n=1 Tax=Bradyrhizobium sp. TaxID=376 RepID=UPI0025C27A0D|nr:PstS family phosphate ABC transporter substrate-binding protein [Bradyrhizobium sp.]MBI5264487.1 PstS family phosphate ABC transporter substrate-binding protein [Bradyrhizobium sp.]